LLNETDKGGEENMSYTRDRGFSRARKLGRDEEGEEGWREKLRDVIDDPASTPADVHDANLEHCPDNHREELHHTLSETAEDGRARRGYRTGARDRSERRRLGKDWAARRARDGGRRYGRDGEGEGHPPDFPGRPHEGGTMTPLDDREHAMDSRLAYDAAVTRGFDARYPGVRNRYR
jgi:hypothetical protein